LSAVTDDAGLFDFTFDVSLSTPLGRRNFTIIAPENGAQVTSEIPVISNVNMTFAVPPEVSPGEVVELLVQVVDASNRPVAGMEVIVNDSDQSSATAADGTVVVSVEVPDPIETSIWTVEMSSAASDEYAESSFTATAAIKNPLPIWIYLAILAAGVIGISSGAGVLWFLRRRNPGFAMRTAAAGSVAVAPDVEITSEPQQSADSTIVKPDSSSVDNGDVEVESTEAGEDVPQLDEVKLSITLERDVEEMPEIVGIGEDATIRIVISTEDKSFLKSAMISVEITGSEPVILDIDADGAVSIEADSTEPGERHIVARYDGSDRLAGAESTMTFWVVDYREAISDIYNRFVDQITASGIKLHSQATPREVERTVVTSVPGVDEKLLDDLVSVFEEADYSLHDIFRADFLKAQSAFDGVSLRTSDDEETSPDASSTKAADDE